MRRSVGPAKLDDMITTLSSLLGVVRARLWTATLVLSLRDAVGGSGPLPEK